MIFKKLIFQHLYFIFILNTIVFAGNTEIRPIVGAKSLALNGLYIAGTDGLMSVNVNPSSLSKLTNKGIGFSVSNLSCQNEYLDQNNNLYRSFIDDDIRFGIGGFWEISETLQFSVFYSRLFEYKTSWPFAFERTNQVGSFVSATNLNNNIKINSITSSFAYSFDDLSIGISLNAYQVINKMSFMIANEAWFELIQLRPAYTIDFDQDGWAYGANFGITFDLSENIRMASFIRNGFEVQMEGKMKTTMFNEISLQDTTGTVGIEPTTTSITTDFKFPWFLGLGSIYKINEELKLNFDIVYSLWKNTYENLAIEIKRENWADSLAKIDTVTGIQANNFPLNFDNSFEFGIGVEYKPEGDFFYRVGYRFSKTPNTSESFSMFFPNVSQHWLSIGFGFEDNEYAFDAAIAYSFGQEENIKNLRNTYNNGRYDQNTFIPSISALYKF